MTMLQLNPSIPVITPKGSGMAFLVIDYSQEHDLMFTCAIDATGEIWTYATHLLKFQKNITLGRNI